MTRFIGFYSFKGGVGRSMALAHCAVELARLGRRVLIVDLDLEAPGQHCSNLFHHLFADDSVSQPGFLGFAAAYSARANQGLPELRSHLVLSTTQIRQRDTNTNKIEKTSPNLGDIHLLPAGDVASPARYSKQLDKFSWEQALKQGGGFGLLRHFRDECERIGFDDILLDSRTGDSDPFYVVALELADILVMVSGYNRQNRLGTEAKYLQLLSYPIDRQPKRIVLVGSPKPSDASFDQSKVALDLPNLRLPNFEVEIPYDARLAMAENLLNLQDADSEMAYPAAIRNLCREIEREQAPQERTRIKQKINPFSVLRSDYADNKELLQCFVDPGDAITRAFDDFMPVMVYGNRGTGKTMLAKHHSYETAANLLGRDDDIKASDMPQRIGLYLRFDIDLLNSFNTRDENLRTEFNKLFASFFDILVARKALAALERFGGISAWCDEELLFQRLLREFSDDLAASSPGKESSLSPTSYRGFQAYIDNYFSSARKYINNPKIQRMPMKLQGNILMKTIVEELTGDSRGNFGNRWFSVMIDEVEHFEKYQQRVLNSRIKQIKHSDRVTFRYFLRHEGLLTRQTTVSDDQIIQESHDYRTLKLDDGLSSEYFQNHVTEIASRQLELRPFLGHIQLGSSQLDLSSLFEALSPEEEARRLIAKSKRSDKLLEWLHKYHPNSGKEFLDWFNAESSALRRTVAVILLNQGKRPRDVALGFTSWNQQARDWYHNYHRSGLHWLCRLYKADKIYSGLDQIILLSGQNVRYFLEYCRAIVDEWIASGDGKGESSRPLELPISATIQDRAIRARAQFYIDDLRGKPRYAAEMLNLVNRLGRIFEAAHSSPKQSQFEVNHFSINDYQSSQSKVLEALLRECRMENVLLRRLGNKQKSLGDDRYDDWVLHPCFAPCFNISTRHKKKLDWLSSADLQVLFEGSQADFNRVLSAAKKKYDLDVSDSLFSTEGADATNDD